MPYALTVCPPACHCSQAILLNVCHAAEQSRQQLLIPKVTLKTSCSALSCCGSIQCVAHQVCATTDVCKCSKVTGLLINESNTEAHKQDWTAYIGKAYNRQLESAPHKLLHHPPGPIDQAPAGAQGAYQHHLGALFQLYHTACLHWQLHPYYQA